MNIYIEKSTLEKLKRYYIRPRIVNGNIILIGFWSKYIRAKQEGNYLLNLNFKKLKFTLYYTLPLILLYFLYLKYGFIYIIFLMVINQIVILNHTIKGGSVIMIESVDIIEKKYVFIGSSVPKEK